MGVQVPPFALGFHRILQSLDIAFVGHSLAMFTLRESSDRTPGWDDVQRIAKALARTTVQRIP